MKLLTPKCELLINNIRQYYQQVERENQTKAMEPSGSKTRCHKAKDSPL